MTVPAKNRDHSLPSSDKPAQPVSLAAKGVSRAFRFTILAAIALACCTAASAARGQETLSDLSPQSVSRTLSTGPESWTSPEKFGSTLQMVLTLTVVSLAPAILLMTTSYVRIAVVLGLLRQALGIQQLPSNQVISSIALFMTLLIMSPVWKDVYDEAVAPYTDPDVQMSADEAWEAGIRPVRRFMSRQIEVAENDDDVWLFFERMPADTPIPENYDDVPIQVLLPAFMLSELKVAFLIGFQVYLPFLILDLVVSSVTISMGMLMLPPMMISMPLKLMLFVLVDGWHLVVGMLLDSFAPYL